MFENNGVIHNGFKIEKPINRNICFSAHEKSKRGKFTQINSLRKSIFVKQKYTSSFMRKKNLITDINVKPYFS